MTRRPARPPSALQLEILKVLWRDGPSSVRQVQAELAGWRDLKYCSVLTIMNRLVTQGYLERTRQGRHFIFRPRFDNEVIVGQMLREFVQRAFDGSVEAMIEALMTLRSDGSASEGKTPWRRHRADTLKDPR